MGLLDVDNGSCPVVRLLPKWLPVLIVSEIVESLHSVTLTLARAIVDTFPAGIPGVDGIIRSARTIHDFVVFLASRVATKGSRISKLE